MTERVAIAIKRTASTTPYARHHQVKSVAGHSSKTRRRFTAERVTQDAGCVQGKTLAGFLGA